jgi:hypothetical protein
MQPRCWPQEELTKFACSYSDSLASGALSPMSHASGTPLTLVSYRWVQMFACKRLQLSQK